MKLPVKSSPWLKAAALLVAVGFSACTAHTAPPPGADELESQELASAVNTYKDQGLMGSDVKGTVFAVSADAEKWSENGEDTESALQVRLLDAFAKSWSKHHPGKHAKLTLRIHNYYGEAMATAAKTV